MVTFHRRTPSDEQIYRETPVSDAQSGAGAHKDHQFKILCYIRPVPLLLAVRVRQIVAEFQVFIAPDSMFSPTRVLLGNTNAVTHLQSYLVEVIQPVLRLSLLHWLEDLLVLHRIVSDLLESIRELFAQCAT